MNLKNLICKIQLYIHKKNISAYIDNSLDKASENKLLQLFSKCPEAKLYFEKLLTIDKRIKSIPISIPSRIIKERVDNEIISIGTKHNIDELIYKHIPKWIYVVSWAIIITLIIITVSLNIIKTKHNKENIELLASMGMYQNMDLYENMDMIEHLQDIMEIKQSNSAIYKELK